LKKERQANFVLEKKHFAMNKVEPIDPEPFDLVPAHILKMETKKIDDFYATIDKH